VRITSGTVCRFFAAFAVLAIVTVAAPVMAKSTAPVEVPQKTIDDLIKAFPNGLTQEQLDAILDVSDPAALRSALRERILAEMAAREAAAAPAIKESPLSFYRHKVRAMVRTWPQIPGMISKAFATPQGIYPPLIPSRLFLYIVLLLGVGAAATIATGLLLRKRRQAVGAAFREKRRGRLASIFLWLLMDFCQVAAFFVAALICYAVMDPHHPLAPNTLEILLRGALFFLVIERIFALITAVDGPVGETMRHARSAARSIHTTAVVVTLLLVLIGAAARILSEIGLQPDAIAALFVPISVIPFAYLIVVGWSNRLRIRDGLSRSLNLGGQGNATHLMWPILATVYLIVLWLVVDDALFRHQSDVGIRALASLVLALFGPLLALSLSSLIARYYAGSHLTAENKETVGPQVMRIMRAVWIVLVFLIIYGTALIWGVDPRAHLGIGSAAVKVIFNVAIVMLLGFVAWSLIVNAIDRAMRRAADEGETTHAQRVKTLLPLLRRTLQIVLVVIIAMVLLSSMGIEIGPLLAGAGVVGIAIGLGAQQTIADILAGVFFLLEDSFRMGDYVEVGNIRGTVEGISMRSLKLRHHRGAVHTLPFGQMKSLTNYTRDWALMRLEFRVAPDTDIALVKKIVKEIGKELSADPEMAKGFIEPLKSQGIRSVEEGAIVIGVKFIAKPSTQFTIRREAYSRILDAFRENGIELVGRSVVVKVEGDGTVSPQAAAAAASTVMPVPDEA
jgi:small-conductance mechanosensitive channel